MDSCSHAAPHGARAPRVAALLRCLTGAGGSAEAVVLRRLHTQDARQLRAAHPRLPAAIAAADWDWNATWRDAAWLALCDRRVAGGAALRAARFAAALPRAACDVSLEYWPHPQDDEAAAASSALAVIRVLPRSLRAVHTSCSTQITPAAILTALGSHLRSLRKLNAHYVALSAEALAALPPTLRTLYAVRVRLPADGMRLGHLGALTALDVYGTAFGDADLAALPPRLRRLDAAASKLGAAARFNHLRHLCHLGVGYTRINDAALASAPHRLTWLNVSHTHLTDGARFAHLPRLRFLGVYYTSVVDAALAELPADVRWLDSNGGTATRPRA